MTTLLDCCFLALTCLSPAMASVSRGATATVLVCAFVWFLYRAVAEKES
jgi:hypothetical protein